MGTMALLLVMRTGKLNNSSEIFKRRVRKSIRKIIIVNLGIASLVHSNIKIHLVFNLMMNKLEKWWILNNHKMF